MRCDARLGVLLVLAAEPHHQGDGLAHQPVFLFVARAFSSASFWPIFQVARFKRGSRAPSRDRAAVHASVTEVTAFSTLFTATRAGVVRDDQRVVAAPHHHQVAQGRQFLTVGVRIVIQAQVFLRSYCRDSGTRSASVFGVEFVPFLHHAQGLRSPDVTQAAHPLHRSETKMEKMYAAPRRALFRSGEVMALTFICHRNFFNHCENCRLASSGETHSLAGHLAQDFRQVQWVFAVDVVAHHAPCACRFPVRPEHFYAIVGIVT